jgi:nucleoredoxin
MNIFRIHCLIVLIISLVGQITFISAQEAAVQTEDKVVEETTGEEEIVDLDETKDEPSTKTADPAPQEEPKQSGPFIDILGTKLLSLKMVDETHAQIVEHYTNDVLSKKKVIGLYFSADWCGPCRQFTPELVNFYNKMNSRRGRENQFEIVWVSRCRDVNSFGQYFTHMNWLALPPELALGTRGQELAAKYKVKGIPHLVLLDEVGNVITYDARNQIPKDKAGIGFPWRNPIATLYVNLVPKSLRMLIKGHVDKVKTVLNRK